MATNNGWNVETPVLTQCMNVHTPGAGDEILALSLNDVSPDWNSSSPARGDELDALTLDEHV